MHRAPGQLIDIEGCRLHLYQQGEGKPAVVLEAGIAGSLLGWSLVQPKIAEFTRVCSYDRAGLGWSGKCAKPRTVLQMVTELAALLRSANVPPPYVLVGHSFGGLLIRAYASLRPEEVAGLVFVDPVSLDAWAHCDAPSRARLAAGAKLSRRGALLARLGIVRFALWVLASGGTRLPKLIARASAGRGASTLQRLTAEVRKLPPEVWPLIRAYWSQPKCFEAMADYLECLPGAALAALALPIPGALPFIVLSAANATPDELRERDAWASASSDGQHTVVPNSAHWIQLEQPNSVVTAVRRICQEALAKNRKPSAAEAAEGL